MHGLVEQHWLLHCALSLGFQVSVLSVKQAVYRRARCSHTVLWLISLRGQGHQPIQLLVPSLQTQDLCLCIKSNLSIWTAFSSWRKKWEHIRTHYTLPQMERESTLKTERYIWDKCTLLFEGLCRKSSSSFFFVFWGGVCALVTHEFHTKKHQHSVVPNLAQKMYLLGDKNNAKSSVVPNPIVLLNNKQMSVLSIHFYFWILGV